MTAFLRRLGAEDRTSPTPEPRPTELELVARVRAGDAGAAALLYDGLRPRMEVIMRTLLGGHHPEHSDLIQQAFVEIIRSLPTFRGECALSTWATTITARIVFRYLRKRVREREVIRSGEEIDDLDAPVSSGRTLMVRNLARRVRFHLDQMPAQRAEAYFLHLSGFAARDIAISESISEAAAHARIERGRRDLHARLSADPELADVFSEIGGEP